MRSLFAFTPSQVRGVLCLLPLLAVLGIVIGFADRPRFEKSFLELADSAAVTRGSRHGAAFPGSPGVSRTDTARPPELFVFDPNTATLQEFCRLGLDTRTAAGIVKYRERGKRFEIPQDFAACYGVTLDDYTRLEPYIRIGEAYRLKTIPAGTTNKPAVTGKHAGTGEPARTDTFVAFDPNLLDAAGFVALGFSPKQADVIVRYRYSIGGFRSKDDLAKCYVVSDEMMARLDRYIIIGNGDTEARTSDGHPGPERAVIHPDRVSGSLRPVELNGADSIALRSVSGIGEVLVVRIMDYRQRLGGFADAAQLAEIRGMSDENMKRIFEQISVDSCVIQKIDVNFAPHKTLVEQMGEHPYVTDVMLRKLLKNRQLKGGWRNIGEMVEQDIMTEKEAFKLSPYLLFRSE